MDVAVRAGVTTLSDTPRPLRCWTRHARAVPAALPSAACPPHTRCTIEHREKEELMNVIATTDAPAAIGPYVQGRIAGGLLFASGQIALDPALLYENYRGGAAKTRAILDLIEQTRASGEKALVFSQFTSYLDELASELAARGIAYYTITGSTPKKERLERAQAFNDDDVPVFLVSLKAGGTGLNLIGASVVIHADPWWNAAAVNQATDRAHRIGQTDVVTVYKMIAKGTIEERILSLQERKAALADAVVGQTGAAALSSLTREELMELLEG